MAKKKTNADPNKYWWQQEKKDAHSAVFKAADAICRQQSRIRDQVVDYLEMYANGNVSGLGLDTTASNASRRYFHGRPEAPRFNIAAAIVDTVVSIVAYNPPIPQYLTIGGSFELIRKAKKRTRVLQGQMHSLGAPLCRRVFRDAAKCGSGFIWGEIGENGLPLLTRTHMLELLVEHNDGFYMQPRSVHRVRSRVSKEWLKENHPKHAAEIEDSKIDSTRSKLLRFTTETSRDTAIKSSSGVCDVIESIHLPAGNSKGWRMLCVSEACLEYEEWTDPYFPLAAFRYRERDFGYYGSGLIESAYDSQIRVDELCDRNAKSQKLGSTMKMFNMNGPGTIKKSEVTNEVGEVWDVNGTQPLQVVTFNGTLEDLQEQVDIELRRLLFVEGVSESQAAGDGASRGLTSGVAIRAEEDSRAGRMSSPLEQYQNGCLETAKLIERTNDRIARKDPEYAPSARARSGRKTFLITSNWAKTAIPEGQVVCEMHPMSSLPQAPSGKFAAVMEWIDGGFADREYGMQLLDFPDIESYADVRLAYIDLVQWQIEQILDFGTAAFPRALPIPRQDYDVAIDLGQRSLAQLITMDPPEDLMVAMDAYIAYAEDLKKTALKKQQAMMAEEAAQQQAAQTPSTGVQGSGGDPNALAGQAPATPAGGPPLVAT